MNDKTLLKNATLVGLEPIKLEQKDLLIVDGRVAQKDDRLQAPRDARLVDCRGRFVLPGFVNAQSRLYASQSLLLPRDEASETTVESLRFEEHDRIARVLTPETIVTSVFAGALEAVRYGTTTVIDRHSSPNCIPGSLDLVRDTVLTVGPRAILSYEVSGRGEEAEQMQAIAENRRFARENRTDRVAGFFSVDSAGRLSDGTLAELVRESRGSIVSSTLGEETEIEGRLLDRLEAAGLLGERPVFSAAGRIEAADREKLKSLGIWTLTCPNANARLGLPPLPFETMGEMVALGTGAVPGDLFSESRSAWLAARARGAAIRPEDVVKLIVGGHQLASEMLGLELGSTRRDAGADFIVLDYHPRTRVVPDNLAAHLLFGMRVADISMVMTDGEFVYRNGAFPEIDIQRLAPLVRRGADELWNAIRGETAVGVAEG